MSKKGFWADPVDIETARKVAKIVGPASAFGMALAEMDRRNQAGEDVVVVKLKGSVLVVPRTSIIDSIVPVSNGVLQERDS